MNPERRDNESKTSNRPSKARDPARKTCLFLYTCLYDILDISIIVEREYWTCWVEDFLSDTDRSSLQLYRTVYKADHSATSILTIYLQSNAIHTGD